MYFGFAVHAEKANLTFGCNESFLLVSLKSELKRNWRGRSEDVKELGVLRGVGANFAQGKSFLLYSFHTQYTVFISSAK